MKSYGSRILEKALALTFRAIDVLGFTIPPIVAAYYWSVGRKMPDEIAQAIGLWILGGGLAFVVLRLVSAPYFVWREDQARITELEDALARPERQIEADMKLFTAALRKDLSAALGRLCATATQPRSLLDSSGITEKEVFAQIADVDRLVSQLSYDTAARVASVQLRNACAAILARQKTQGRWFYSQRMITFRILHKEDFVSDLMSLMELEIELEKRGESTLGEGASSDQSVLMEIKELMKKLGDNYYDPEVRASLKKSIGRTIT